MSSLTVKHSCTKCSTFVGIDSGFYCCPSCNMIGTMESVATSKPNISFCFKDIDDNKHNFQVDASILENFTGHTVLNKVKLTKHLCKMPSLFVKATNNIVTSMALKYVNAVTNMNINKDAVYIVSQHN